jgi:hypothetical protein
VVESRSVPSSFPASVVNAQMQVRNFIVRWMVWGFQSDVSSSVLVFSAVHSELDSGRGVSVFYEYSRPGHLLVAHGRAEWSRRSTTTTTESIWGDFTTSVCEENPMMLRRCHY